MVDDDGAMAARASGHKSDTADSLDRHIEAWLNSDGPK